MIAVRLEAKAPRDPGLQAERTALAWSRTGLAVFVNALLALRSGWLSSQAPITVLGITLLIASAAAALFGAWRRRHLMSRDGVTALPPLAIGATAIVALVACAAAIASILIAAH
jgi:uncharacterized membrane protein YidH (DUF202 family)